MKIIFAGTPELAVPTLATLNDSTHDVIMVLTQPDRPAGRGRKLKSSAVKTFAEAHNIPVCQPETLKTLTIVELLRNLKPDLMVVLAYGLIVPKTVLEIPTLGCINVHLSLLPRWRGAAPIQRAILAGDKTTGVTLMKMDTGIDTGDILKQAELPIHDHDTSATLHQRLGKLGAMTLSTSLNDITTEKLKGERQNEEQMTYAKKITKEEACINWQLSAEQIERRVRAFNSWPIAYTTLNKIRLRIWQAHACDEKSTSKPGTIIETNKDHIKVACHQGTLSITQLQWPGGNVQTVQVALNANNNPLKIGVVLGEA